jgi:hypothetical protein
MTKVVFFPTHPLFQRHFATDLELIQQHIDHGDDVTMLYCDDELIACDINPYHEVGQCLLCRATRAKGASFISSHPTFHQRSYVNLTPENIRELQTMQTTFASLTEIQTYHLDNYDVGMAALSSVVSYVMNAELDIVEHQDILKRYILSGAIAYRSIQNYIRKHNPDRIYCFNGRMAIVRAIVRACESEGVPFTVHEAASGNDTYSLSENSLPHNIQLTTERIQQHWYKADIDPEARMMLARQWFDDRAKGAKVNGYSFVQSQQEGLLPIQWNDQKRNIIIFNSADFEFVWVSEEYQHHLYHDQLDGIRRIAESLLPFKEQYHLYLRIHPNLARIDNELRPLLQLHYENLVIILPEEKISTYSLIQHADKVISFGSTVGIEAPYWCKPSISGGRSLYQLLGSTYNPESHEELMALVMQDNLPLKPIEGSLQYGYFYNSFGIPFTHYQPRDFFGGTFDGQELFANRWLFRSFTLYKTIVPEALRTQLNRSHNQRTLTKLLGSSSIAQKLLQ